MASRTVGETLVLLSQARRVAHLAVWAGNRGAEPICGTPGDMPGYGLLRDFPDATICKRCSAEVTALYNAVRAPSGSGQETE